MVLKFAPTNSDEVDILLKLLQNERSADYLVPWIKIHSVMKIRILEMPYVGDSLEKDGCLRIETLPLLKLVYSIAEAVRHIHSLGVAHLDIKPDNIVLDRHSWDARLIDFDHASCAEMTSGYRGTVGWSAPEICDNNTRYDGKRADIWSLGKVILWVLDRNLTGIDVSSADVLRDVAREMMAADPYLRLSLASASKSVKALLDNEMVLFSNLAIQSNLAAILV